MTVEVRGPKDVPNLRIHLLDQWSPGRAYRSVARQQTMAVPGTSFEDRRAKEEHIKAFCDGEINIVKGAQLWWVSADMVDIMEAAAPAVPDDAQVKDLVPPSHSGLVVFEKPWHGVDATIPEHSVTVNAMTWAFTRMPPVPSRPFSEYCLSVSCYRRLDMSERPDATEIEFAIAMGLLTQKDIDLWPSGEGKTTWAYIGKSDWPITDALNQAPYAECSEEQALSFIEDRRIITALFTLVAQRAIAETTYHPIQRPDRRRSDRAGIPSEAQELRVITLRKTDRNVPVDDDGEPISESRYSHRWVVNPFYRWQRVGPGRKERRLTLVSGHVRGPESKPLKIKQEVRAWVR